MSKMSKLEFSQTGEIWLYHAKSKKCPPYYLQFPKKKCDSKIYSLHQIEVVQQIMANFKLKLQWNITLLKINFINQTKNHLDLYTFANEEQIYLCHYDKTLRMHEFFEGIFCWWFVIETFLCKRLSRCLKKW